MAGAPRNFSIANLGITLAPRGTVLGSSRLGMEASLLPATLAGQTAVNYFLNPRAVDYGNPADSRQWVGTSGLSVTHVSSGGPDGRRYVRATCTTAGNRSVYTTKSAGLSYTLGDTFTYSVWVRHVGAMAERGATITVRLGGDMGSDSGSYSYIRPDGTWQEVRRTFTVTEYEGPSDPQYITVTASLQLGERLEVSSPFLDRGTREPLYADGTTSGWAWSGTANGSTSSGTYPNTDPDFTAGKSVVTSLTLSFRSAVGEDLCVVPEVSTAELSSPSLDYLSDDAPVALEVAYKGQTFFRGATSPGTRSVEWDRKLNRARWSGNVTALGPEEALAGQQTLLPSSAGRQTLRDLLTAATSNLEQFWPASPDLDIGSGMTLPARDVEGGSRLELVGSLLRAAGGTITAGFNHQIPDTILWRGADRAPTLDLWGTGAGALSWSGLEVQRATFSAGLQITTSTGQVLAVGQTSGATAVELEGDAVRAAWWASMIPLSSGATSYPGSVTLPMQVGLEPFLLKPLPWRLVAHDVPGHGDMAATVLSVTHTITTEGWTVALECGPPELLRRQNKSLPRFTQCSIGKYSTGILDIAFAHTGYAYDTAVILRTERDKPATNYLDPFSSLPDYGDMRIVLRDYNAVPEQPLIATPTPTPTIPPVPVAGYCNAQLFLMNQEQTVVYSASPVYRVLL